MPLTSGPLILLSPAKTLDFTGKLSTALAGMTPTQPRMLAEAGTLISALKKISKSELKSLMSLSPALTDLNHGRFQDFDAQPARMALGAFEGAAYKGLDAKSLSPKALDYCQSHLRILCGLYGVLRPYDEIRPYRLEMSTRLSVGGAKDLYAFWAESLTQSLHDEAAAAVSGCFVLNVASQEYAKAVRLGAFDVPVVTAVFPGPAVYAKQARGEMVRFCAENSLTSPDGLRAFRGTSGAWRFVPESSDETTYMFHRGAAAASSTPKAAAAKAAAKATATEQSAARGGGKRRAASEASVEGEASEGAAPAVRNGTRRRQRKS